MKSTTYILIWQYFECFLLIFLVYWQAPLALAYEKNLNLILLTGFVTDHHLIEHYETVLTSSITYMTEISVVIRQCT